MGLSLARPSGVRRLLTCCFILSLPLLLVLALYFVCDPFKVLWHHANYYPPNGQHVTLNRDFVSFECFNNNSLAYQYDSFILGNSRSIFYEWKEWSRHIHSERIFHFDASSESLLGIALKLRYLDSRSAISNCLIIIDAHTLATATNHPGHIFTKHYALSGENPFSFHWKFLKVFLQRNFLLAYCDFRVRGQFRPYMRDILEERRWDYDPAHNELSLHSTLEREIGDGLYYARNARNFRSRDGREHVGAPVIGAVQRDMLQQIREILARHRSSYRLVISPLYDQVRLAPEDLRFLCATFGAQNVFDFSGVNELTSRIENYYEDSHYRPVVASLVMTEIYRNRDLSVTREAAAQ
jgi:hypothetical protein